MSISLCMIAKNEEDCIGNALESVSHFVDEIIVVDAGSTDHTMEIAKNYHAKIIETKWQKDFSLHRNQAICAAKGTWILFLDCDETLQTQGTLAIKTLLNTPTENEIKGYNVTMVNMIDTTPFSSFMSLRLFRNHEGFLFEGPIHEQIMPSILNKYSIHHIAFSPLTIHHHGYNESVIIAKKKIQRNLEILFSIPNQNGYSHAMIGDEYLKAHNLNKAILFYEKSIALNKTFQGDYIPMFIVNYLSALINLKCYHDALRLIDQVRHYIPLFRDLYFLEYWILYHTYEFDTALIKLDEYLLLPHNSQPIIEVKRYENIYDLNALRSQILSILSVPSAKEK